MCGYVVKNLILLIDYRAYRGAECEYSGYIHRPGYIDADHCSLANSSLADRNGFHVARAKISVKSREDKNHT